MTDVHSPEVRSKNMSAIRGRDTKPELMIRRALHKLGFRYRLSPAEIAGKPDLYFPKYKAVIFVHGCFWHAHSCYLFKLPSSRVEFWREKLEGNVERDKQTVKLLLDSGYRVLILWECSMKGKHKPDKGLLLDSVDKWLKGSGMMGTADYEGFRLGVNQHQDTLRCWYEISESSDAK